MIPLNITPFRKQKKCPRRLYLCVEKTHEIGLLPVILCYCTNMKTKITVGILVLAALGIWYYRSSRQAAPTETVKEQNTVHTVEYACGEGKTISAAFGDTAARIALSDKRVLM